MAKKPIIFKTNHIPKYYEIDPLGHLSTVHYPRYYIDHRLEGMRRFIGLDTKDLMHAPVSLYVIHISCHFLKPVVMDQQLTIHSFVAEVKEKTCNVQCEMLDENATQLSTCQMDCICIDTQTRRPITWPDDYISRFFEG